MTDETLEPLYPNGIEDKKQFVMTEETLRKLQDETDAAGVLLPTELNRILKRKYADTNDEEIQPLLPTNL